MIEIMASFISIKDNKRCIWTLLAFVVLTLASANTFQPVCLHKGNFQAFDPSTQVCCNGVHAKFVNGHENDCCMMSTSDGEIEELFNKTTSRCCESILYKLHPREMRKNPVCCGDQVLTNWSSEFCCGNKLYTRSKKHFNCFNRGNISFAIEEGERVCHMQNEDGTFQVKLFTKEEVRERGSDCCGLNLYKRGHTHFCFKRTILLRKGVVPEECGPKRTVIDASKMVCCKDTGKLIPIPESYSSKYHNIGPNLGCFKGELVDLDVYSIASSGSEEHIIPKHSVPCGSDSYDPQNKRGRGICCKGTVHYHHIDMNADCCGTELIDSDKHNCCNDSKIPKSQKCCGKTSYNKYQDDVICCNRQLYNDSYLCCKPQSSLEIPTLKQKRNDNSCCGKTTFHPLEAECCDGKVQFGSQGCNVLERAENYSTSLSLIVNKIIEKVNKSIVAEKNKENRTTRNSDCPACLQYETPYTDCVRLFGFQVYVYKISENRNRTKLHVLFLEPKLMRKTRMILFTTGKCRCFEANTIYDMYSNRNLKDRVELSKRFRSKFTERDIFYEVKGNFGNFHKAHTCQVGKYFKPIVH